TFTESSVMAVESRSGPPHLWRALERGPKPATLDPVVDEVQRPRVLVVDDDSQVAKALTRMLRKYCLVEVACSVDEAEIVLREKNDFTLIRCDLLLPVRGGLELYRSLRNNHSPLAERLAFMTGLGEDAVEADEFREVPCLGKPIDLDRVRQLLER